MYTRHTIYIYIYIIVCIMCLLVYIFAGETKVDYTRQVFRLTYFIFSKKKYTKQTITFMFGFYVDDLFDCYIHLL